MDDETDTGAYNPVLADTGVSGGTQTQGDEYFMDAPPAPPDEGSRKEANSWWRSIMDAARKQFGINDVNANAPAEGAEPAGLPQQAGDEEQGEQPGQPDEHEPAGLPVQAGDDSASFDRKTGTAGGMRTRPTQPTMVGPDAEPEVPGQALKNQTAALAKAGEFLFADRPPTGPEDPEAAGYGGKGAVGNALDTVGENIKQGPAARIIQYLTGHGAEDNTQRLAREQETEAQLPPGTDKNTVRRMALEKNAAENGPEAAVAQYQNHKSQYNKFKALAGAALDHGDPAKAAELFNEAQTYLPHGVKVTASPGSGGGMNIHISDPTGGSGSGTGGTPAQDIKLTGEQFRELTHMRVGEFDHVLERGITKNLTDLAKTPGMSQAPGQTPATPAGRQPNTAQPGDKMTRGVRVNGGTGEGTQPPMGGKPVPFGSLMSPRQRAALGFGDVLPSNSRGQAADDGQRPRQLPTDNSPESRAIRATQWASQNKPGQRERLTEQYRQEDQKEKNATRALDIKEKESDRKRDYGTENLGIKRDQLAQKDRHLGYLIDKSTGELNEKMMAHLEQVNGRNAANFVRAMDGKMRAGFTLTPDETKGLEEVQQRFRTPASRPSTLNGGGQTPPASGRGVAPPPGSTAPPPGQDPRGRWQINTATQQRRWVPYQQ